MVKVIPSGSLRLDIALGIGGIPCGAYSEISGADSSGKTTLCLHIISQAQRLGGVCAFIDNDHSLSASYARHCGVQVDQLWVAQPQSTEQALEITESLTKSQALSVIVFDSIDSLVPASELNLSFSEEIPSVGDTLLSQALHHLVPIVRRANIAFILTQKTNKQLSSVYHKLIENPGRLAVKLLAELRIELNPMNKLFQDNTIIGEHIQARILKNKYMPCPSAVEFDIMYNTGIIKVGEILDLGTEIRLINKFGKRYFFRNLVLGEHREAIVNYLLENPHVTDELEQVIRHRLLLPVPNS